MKSRFQMLICACFMAGAISSGKELKAAEFTFFQLNLWEGMSNVDNGRQALYDQLVALMPDAASFCEFRHIGEAEEVLDGAIEYIREKTGVTYFRTCMSGSGTRGLLTRHPVIEGPESVPSSGHGATNSWFYRTVVDFYGQEIALYASHAVHYYYACYLPRGYGDGSTPYGWDKLEDGPITDVNYIIERETQSLRHEIANDLADDAQRQKQKGRMVIFGGDLNQPSHLDWTAETADMYEHRGCIVPWTISVICYDRGLKDAFRTVYPDPVTHPGVTWPVYNKDAKVATQWLTDADERDRIDYVYYLAEDRITPVKAQLVGPDSMVSHSERVPDGFIDAAAEIILPAGVWPSDHRGLLVTFSIDFPSGQN